jgi:prevent-host-death family protein
MVNIADAKARLSEYLKLVERGETVVLARRNRPIAEIKPIRQRIDRPRPSGLCAGEFEVPESFDEPLPESVLADFEGK